MVLDPTVALQSKQARVLGRNALACNIILDFRKLCHNRVFWGATDVMHMAEAETADSQKPVEAKNRRRSQNSWSGFCDAHVASPSTSRSQELLWGFLFARGSFSVTPASANDRPAARFFVVFFNEKASNRPEDAQQKTAEDLMTYQKAAADKLLPLLCLQFRLFNKSASTR